MMQWVRTGRIAKVIAVFFLLWTGVDLVNPSVCALDRLENPPVTLNGVGTGASMHAAVAPGSQSPTTSADDCFCCSHSVLNSTAASTTPAAGRIETIRFVRPDHTYLLHAPFYHPPQLV